jgi:hypothetical protein
LSRGGTGGGSEDIRKECKRVNVVEICIHVGKWKSETCQNYSRDGERRIKKNDGGMNSTMTYYKNFCKCYNVPPKQQ